MFGILRPCRHRLSPRLHADWLAHLCGLCLTLRDEHGHLARVVTNYDGLMISSLVEAQAPAGQGRRDAGPCPLRAMRPTSVASGAGAQLAATVSLVLAAAKVRDHVVDGDGMFSRRTVAGAARRVADRWATQGGATGSRIGFDTTVLTEAVDRQGEVERALLTGDPVLLATEPTEQATAAAFAHTAVLAGRPENAAALAEAGRLFGRAAHLLDAVEDLTRDRESGAWNPLLATGTDLGQARRHCDDAVHGVRLALAEVELGDGGLTHQLLAHELHQAVHRTFGHHEIGVRDPYGHQPGMPGPYHQAPYPAQPPPYGPGGPTPPPPPPPAPPGGGGKGGAYDGKGGGCWVPKFRVPPRKRNFFAGCGIAAYMCCTCQICCRDPWPGPWSGKPHSSCDCDCDCCNCDC
ncbi:DUF5685 family protein [Amycolatopsis suaedae]|uniref:Regulatory protein n=1 Tax=Amycolatopsis suaedae TaxID=2510978 RepID=A0A4Q7J9C3_9PSEU|nr:DUF5685 family protein [Amycolatopsis suaedae]RZQ63003.1 hypothetical protein EWH70_15015 [Amycolatopsis suaedae]